MKDEGQKRNMNADCDIYCCQCNKKIKAKLVTGKDISSIDLIYTIIIYGSALVVITMLIA